VGTDCANGAACANGKCISGSTCDPDGHTVRDPAGTTMLCDPYVCSGGACKPACNSVADCVAPNVCNTSNECVAPPSAPGDSGGCAIARAASNDSDARARAWLLSAMAIGAVLARRRRRSPTA
jgi:MYXO-CTERM domain-containing protein